MLYIFIYICTMIYYSAIKMSEIMFSETTWKDKKDIMLNEISSDRDV